MLLVIYCFTFEIFRLKPRQCWRIFVTLFQMRTKIRYVYYSGSIKITSLFHFHLSSVTSFERILSRNLGPSEI